MLESYWIKGVLIGLVFGVPAGAIGALTIQRTLAHGFLTGLITGLGSSAADILYACVGICGLTVVSDFLLAHQSGISLAGGAMIIAMGVMILRKKALTSGVSDGASRLSACFVSSFAIAIANPATILSFVVVFASWGIASRPVAAQCGQLIGGILVGTGCWWGLLSGIVSRFQSRMTTGAYQTLNRLLGGLMILFGLAMIVRQW